MCKHLSVRFGLDLFDGKVRHQKCLSFHFRFICKMISFDAESAKGNKMCIPYTLNV